MEFLNGLASDKRYADFVTLEIMGKSTEGRDLVVVKIEKEPSKRKRRPGQKPIIWLDAGIHAREWIAPATGLYIVQKLLEERSESVRRLLDFFDFHILPLFNPDGYEYSHTRVSGVPTSEASLLTRTSALSLYSRSATGERRGPAAVPIALVWMRTATSASSGWVSTVSLVYIQSADQTGR